MTPIMRNTNSHDDYHVNEVSRRAEQKEESLHRILDAGAARLCREGLAGAAIADVMHDAGLTHGAFYVHFRSKNELAATALRHALLENRQRWVGALKRETWRQRLRRLASRYLTRKHRDDPGSGCALAALVSEAARGDAAFRRAYEGELLKSLHGVCRGSDIESKPTAEQFDDAAAFLAMCIGGLSLARAVADDDLSERILRACAAAAGRIASAAPDG